MVRLTRFLFAAAIAFSALNCASGEDPSGVEGAATVRDNIPGTLVITSPERAAFIAKTDGALEIVGTGASTALTVNGKSVKVDADGSFKARMIPEPGLNVIVAVDGDSRLETPFVYGNFAPFDEQVPHAVAVNVGAKAIHGAPPVASLTTIANMVLKDQNLVGLLEGQNFAGEFAGANFNYRIDRATVGAMRIDLDTSASGLGVKAVVDRLAVKGNLTIRFGFTKTDDVTISVNKGTVTGDAKLAVNDGVIGGEVPDAEVKIDGFKYDSNNAGFPCCVDGIITNVIQGRIEGVLRDAIRNEVPKAVKLTLEGMGLPTELDLTGIGFAKPIPLASRFDSLDFSTDGGTLTASLLFGRTFEPNEPGSRAPGWLKLGDASLARKMTVGDGLGVSFSLDSINQLFFALWGSGSLARPMPNFDPLSDIQITPELPPMISVTEAGAVRVALGEVKLRAKLSGNPFTAAISIMQDVLPSVEEQTLTLTPQGEPLLSITWLDADAVPEGLRKVVVGVAKGQIATYLKPFHFPIPDIALDALGPSFRDHSLAIQAPKLDIDGPAARLALSGEMLMVR